MKEFVSWFNGLPRKTQAISGFIVILALCGLSIGTAILQIQRTKNDEYPPAPAISQSADSEQFVPTPESAANADESQHFESALSETAVPDGIEDRMAEWLAEADEPNDLMENEDFVDFMLNDVGMSEEELRENIAEAQSEVEAAGQKLRRANARPEKHCIIYPSKNQMRMLCHESGAHPHFFFEST